MIATLKYYSLNITRSRLIALPQIEWMVQEHVFISYGDTFLPRKNVEALVKSDSDINVNFDRQREELWPLRTTVYISFVSS